MLLSTFTFAMHTLMASFRVLRPVVQVLEYVLPTVLSSRNMATKAVKGKINFNTKHLKKGDPLPPYTGKLRIYNMRYCPYAQRTILALNAKNIDYEVVNINLMEKPEWLTTKSAFGKVPSLEIKENVVIYESLVTVEYLDEVYPQRPLLPKDPVKRAYDKIIIEATGPIQSFFYRSITMPETVTEDTIAAYHKALDFLQSQLQSRGTKFLDGAEPGFADYMIWPWFERILALEDTKPSFKIDPKKYQLLLEYFKNMENDPVVKDYIVPKDILAKFLDSYKIGQANYELLTEN